MSSRFLESMMACGAALMLATGLVSAQGLSLPAKPMERPRHHEGNYGLSQAQPASKTVQPKPSARAEWSPPRTPWGDPDVAGIFTTDDEPRREETVP